MFRLWLASDLKNRPRFENTSYTIWARIVSVYDGDTFTIAFCSKGKIYRRNCRCKGYDSPEMRGDNKEAAIAARDFLQNLLPKRIFRLKVCGLDKYGRLLVDVKINKLPLCDIMVLNNHGYYYNGGKKQE
jgi:endonuclease YncB( thermonuclease family)